MLLNSNCLNLPYQPTLYIALFSCNLQKFVADFREITPNIANAWCSALWGQLLLTGFLHGHSFCLSFLLFEQLQKLLHDTLEWGRESKHKKGKRNIMITFKRMIQAAAENGSIFIPVFLKLSPAILLHEENIVYSAHNCYWIWAKKAIVDIQKK